MRRAWVLLLALCALTAWDLGPARTKTGPRDPDDLLLSPSPVSNGLFGIAQVETIWLGADPTGTQVVEGGVWDFDNRGTLACPVGDDPGAYIKNGAFAQGWTSEDVYEQKGLYWHAEDFTHPDLSCSPGPMQGTYSAWCGVTTPDPSWCFVDPPGYGSGWSQWLCRTVPLASANNRLQYTFRSDTESGHDYCYVLIDGEFPDSCGWVGDLADTIRCYDGAESMRTEIIDLSDLASDPDPCDEMTTGGYDGDTVKICFVVVSDAWWDDEDGNYATCDGAMTVDSVSVTADLGSGPTVLYEDFESGVIAEFTPGGGWGNCGGWSSGDYSAIRDVNSFVNDATCGFTDCDMSGCVLTFFDPSIPGEYGMGGHYAGAYYNRAWSPAIYVGSYPTRGYVLKYDTYYYLPTRNWIFTRRFVSYKQDSDCPTGVWSRPVSNDYWYDDNTAWCSERMQSFGSWGVPADAESVKFSLGAWNGCVTWEVPCKNGNESPIFDNVRVGIVNMAAPETRMYDNYTDAFPEADTLGADAWAMMDVSRNLSSGSFLRLGDSLVVSAKGANVMVELCFRIVPGAGTDLNDDFFTTWFPGGYAACDTSALYCARMDTAFTTGAGQTMKYLDRFASVFHEEDPRYAEAGGEGVEIFPDSLFTPGTKIFYYVRTSFLPGPGPYATAPFGVDPGDVSTMYEVSVLPDMCEDPAACLLFVDYYGYSYVRKPIEDALTRLGRAWDGFHLLRDDRYGPTGGNGVGNRFLGPGKYRLDREGNPTTDKLIIGPSLEHLAQYSVILVSTGSFGQNYALPSDGGICASGIPTKDVGLLDNWINEGPARGLWFTGNDLASTFSPCSPSSPRYNFLRHVLAADLVHGSYQQLVSHDLFENCRVLKARDGEMKIVNKYSKADSMRFVGSGCPQRYRCDVLAERDGESGHEFVSLMYDESGYYASVDHTFAAAGAPGDSVRTKLDGFSIHQMRNLSPLCGEDDNIGPALYMRDVLGGFDSAVYPGFFYDRELEAQYCPPLYPEDLNGVPGAGSGRTYVLFQNYPNPFGGGSRTTIKYSVAEAGVVELRIFDAAGRLVHTMTDQAKRGDNFILWDGKDTDGRKLASGVYFYQIKTGAFTAHKKMLLVR